MHQDELLSEIESKYGRNNSLLAKLTCVTKETSLWTNITGVPAELSVEILGTFL